MTKCTDTGKGVTRLPLLVAPWVGASFAPGWDLVGTKTGLTRFSRIDRLFAYPELSFAFLRSVANTLAGVIERKRAEEALQKAKDELEIIVRRRTSKLKRLYRHNKLILDAVGDGICGVDIHGTTTFINPAAMAMTGFDAEDLIGRDFHDLLHPAMLGGTPYPRELSPIHASYTLGETYCGPDKR